MDPKIDTINTDPSSPADTWQDLASRPIVGSSEPLAPVSPESVSKEVNQFNGMIANEAHPASEEFNEMVGSHAEKPTGELNHKEKNYVKSQQEQEFEALMKASNFDPEQSQFVEKNLKEITEFLKGIPEKDQFSAAKKIIPDSSQAAALVAAARKDLAAGLEQSENKNRNVFQKLLDKTGVTGNWNKIQKNASEMQKALNIRDKALYGIKTLANTISLTANIVTLPIKAITSAGGYLIGDKLVGAIADMDELMGRNLGINAAKIMRVTGIRYSAIKLEESLFGKSTGEKYLKEIIDKSKQGGDFMATLSPQTRSMINALITNQGGVANEFAKIAQKAHIELPAIGTAASMTDEQQRRYIGALVNIAENNYANNREHVGYDLEMLLGGVDKKSAVEASKAGAELGMTISIGSKLFSSLTGPLQQYIPGIQGMAPEKVGQILYQFVKQGSNASNQVDWLIDSFALNKDPEKRIKLEHALMSLTLAGAVDYVAHHIPGLEGQAGNTLYIGVDSGFLSTISDKGKEFIGEFKNNRWGKIIELYSRMSMIETVGTVVGGTVQTNIENAHKPSPEMMQYQPQSKAPTIEDLQRIAPEVMPLSEGPVRQENLVTFEGGVAAKIPMENGEYYWASMRDGELTAITETGDRIPLMNIKTDGQFPEISMLQNVGDQIVTARLAVDPNYQAQMAGANLAAAAQDLRAQTDSTNVEPQMAMDRRAYDPNRVNSDISGMQTRNPDVQDVNYTRPVLHTDLAAEIPADKESETLTDVKIDNNSTGPNIANREALIPVTGKDASGSQETFYLEANRSTNAYMGDIGNGMRILLDASGEPAAILKSTGGSNYEVATLTEGTDNKTADGTQVITDKKVTIDGFMMNVDLVADENGTLRVAKMTSSEPGVAFFNGNKDIMNHLKEVESPAAPVIPATTPEETKNPLAEEIKITKGSEEISLTVGEVARTFGEGRSIVVKDAAGNDVTFTVQRNENIQEFAERVNKAAGTNIPTDTTEFIKAEQSLFSAYDPVKYAPVDVVNAESVDSETKTQLDNWVKNVGPQGQIERQAVIDVYNELVSELKDSEESFRSEFKIPADEPLDTERLVSMAGQMYTAYHNPDNTIDLTGIDTNVITRAIKAMENPKESDPINGFGDHRYNGITAILEASKITPSTETVNELDKLIEVKNADGNTVQETLRDAAVSFQAGRSITVKDEDGNDVSVKVEKGDTIEEFIERVNEVAAVDEPTNKVAFIQAHPGLFSIYDATPAVVKPAIESTGDLSPDAKTKLTAWEANAGLNGKIEREGVVAVYEGLVVKVQGGEDKFREAFNIPDSVELNTERLVSMAGQIYNAYKDTDNKINAVDALDKAITAMAKPDKADPVSMSLNTSYRSLVNIIEGDQVKVTTPTPVINPLDENITVRNSAGTEITGTLREAIVSFQAGRSIEVINDAGDSVKVTVQSGDTIESFAKRVNEIATVDVPETREEFIKAHPELFSAFDESKSAGKDTIVMTVTSSQDAQAKINQWINDGGTQGSIQRSNVIDIYNVLVDELNISGIDVFRDKFAIPLSEPLDTERLVSMAGQIYMASDKTDFKVEAVAAINTASIKMKNDNPSDDPIHGFADNKFNNLAEILKADQSRAESVTPTNDKVDTIPSSSESTFKPIQEWIDKAGLNNVERTNVVNVYKLISDELLASDANTFRKTYHIPDSVALNDQNVLRIAEYLVSRQRLESYQKGTPVDINEIKHGYTTDSESIFPTNRPILYTGLLNAIEETHPETTPANIDMTTRIPVAEERIMSYSEIARTLQAGDKLTVNDKEITIKEGDTLYQIAKDAGIPYDDIPERIIEPNRNSFGAFGAHTPTTPTPVVQIPKVEAPVENNMLKEVPLSDGTKITYAEIARTLHPGDVLQINGEAYTVKEGDTLSRIAEVKGIAYNDIPAMIIDQNKSQFDAFNTEVSKPVAPAAPAEGEASPAKPAELTASELLERAKQSAIENIVKINPDPSAQKNFSDWINQGDISEQSTKAYIFRVYNFLNNESSESLKQTYNLPADLEVTPKVVMAMAEQIYNTYKTADGSLSVVGDTDSFAKTIAAMNNEDVSDNPIKAFEPTDTKALELLKIIEPKSSDAASAAQPAEVILNPFVAELNIIAPKLSLDIQEVILKDLTDGEPSNVRPMKNAGPGELYAVKGVSSYKFSNGENGENETWCAPFALHELTGINIQDAEKLIGTLNGKQTSAYISEATKDTEGKITNFFGEVLPDMNYVKGTNLELASNETFKELLESKTDEPVKFLVSTPQISGEVAGHLFYVSKNPDGTIIVEEITGASYHPAGALAAFDVKNDEVIVGKFDNAKDFENHLALYFPNRELDILYTDQTKEIIDTAKAAVAQPDATKAATPQPTEEVTKSSTPVATEVTSTPEAKQAVLLSGTTEDGKPLIDTYLSDRKINLRDNNSYVLLVDKEGNITGLQHSETGKNDLFVDIDNTTSFGRTTSGIEIYNDRDITIDGLHYRVDMVTDETGVWKIANIDSLKADGTVLKANLANFDEKSRFEQALVEITNAQSAQSATKQPTETPTQVPTETPKTPTLEPTAASEIPFHKDASGNYVNNVSEYPSDTFTYDGTQYVIEGDTAYKVTVDASKENYEKSDIKMIAHDGDTNGDWKNYVFEENGKTLVVTEDGKNVYNALKWSNLKDEAIEIFYDTNAGQFKAFNINNLSLYDVPIDQIISVGIAYDDLNRIPVAVKEDPSSKFDLRMILSNNELYATSTSLDKDKVYIDDKGSLFILDAKTGYFEIGFPKSTDDGKKYIYIALENSHSLYQYYDENGMTLPLVGDAEQIVGFVYGGKVYGLNGEIIQDGNVDMQNKVATADGKVYQILEKTPEVSNDATQIPKATNTPSTPVSMEPTSTQQPTETSIPTETQAKEPTSTQEPTETSTRIPTEVPSATLRPTETSTIAPTNTQVPTETQEPTETSTKVPTVEPSATLRPTEASTQTETANNTPAKLQAEQTDIPDKAVSEPVTVEKLNINFDEFPKKLNLIANDNLGNKDFVTKDGGVIREVSKGNDVAYYDGAGLRVDDVYTTSDGRIYVNYLGKEIYRLNPDQSITFIDPDDYEKEGIASIFNPNISPAAIIGGTAAVLGTAVLGTLGTKAILGRKKGTNPTQRRKSRASIISGQKNNGK